VCKSSFLIDNSIWDILFKLERDEELDASTESAWASFGYKIWYRKGYFLSLVTSYDTGKGSTTSLLSLDSVTAMNYVLQMIGRIDYIH